MFIIWGRKKDWGKQILRGLFFSIEHYDDAFSARFSSSVSFANEKKVNLDILMNHYSFIVNGNRVEIL